MLTCPFCGGTSRLRARTMDFNRKISRQTFDYRTCKSCDLTFLSNPPSDLGSYYPADYYAIPTDEGDVRNAARLESYKIDLTTRFVRQGRLLEVGPAYGAFLVLASDAGFDVTGLEMDQECCGFIETQLGFRAINSADVAGTLAKEKPFDVIALWHVIEHLEEPWEVLRAVSLSLNPGGVVLIAAPNPEALQFSLFGKYWTHIDAPRHLFLPSIAWITSAARQVGLEAELATCRDQGSLGWNRFGWAFSIKNVRGRDWPGVFENSSAAILGSIWSPLERYRKNGCTYTMVLRKV